LKLLFIDIETTPNMVYTWGLFNQNISIDQVITPTSVLCFTAKWADSKELIYCRSEKQSGPEFKNMIRKAHALLEEADAVCHYNGVSFDIPRLNQEFLLMGLHPPSPSKQIDLKRVVMGKFSMTSSKLAFVGPYLKIGEKVKHQGWDLWRGCLSGDKEAWATMEKYNKQDVLLLERLYKKVLPWIDVHPNMNLYVDVSTDKPVCPNCGKETLQRRGFDYALVHAYIRYKCTGCGKWSRSRFRDKNSASTKVR
jgi:uncharacterized protein YprB with RNaseH-like and TPR domain